MTQHPLIRSGKTTALYFGINVSMGARSYTKNKKRWVSTTNGISEHRWAYFLMGKNENNSILYCDDWTSRYQRKEPFWNLLHKTGGIQQLQHPDGWVGKFVEALFYYNKFGRLWFEERAVGGGQRRDTPRRVLQMILYSEELSCLHWIF